jgi:MerR family transcriptional regulator, copper efflux regulator
LAKENGQKERAVGITLFLSRSQSGRVWDCSPVVNQSQEVCSVKKVDEYLKIAEAAQFLGVSVNTLRKWADEGRIAATVNPVNGYRLFLKEDLQEFLKELAPSRTKRKKTK